MDEAAIRLTGSGVEIPPLGLGTWAWGDTRTWGWGAGGYDTSYGPGTVAEAYAASIAAGVPFFDTAEGYGSGESERILGRLRADDESHRAEVVVATKFVPFPFRFLPGLKSLTAALLDALHASLARLRMPWVHLYQIHGPVSLRPHRQMAEALASAHRAGLLRAVGVSNYSESEMRTIHRELEKRGVALATNQVEYSLLRTMPERVGLLAAARELGVTVLAYSPIGQGRLTGKYSAAHPPPGKRGFSAYPMAQIDPLVAELRRIGERHGGKTPAQVALNWLVAKGAVPIPGAKNRRQAEENAGALGWRIDEGEVRSLDALGKFGQRTVVHRAWQHG